MPTLDDFCEPTIQPILDSNESSNALSPKPPNNPRKPSTHPTHRNHLDHKGNQEEQHQWLKSINNQYSIAIECVDEALYETKLKGNPREFLNIHVNSPLEVEKMEITISKKPTSLTSHQFRAHMENLWIHLVSLTLLHMRSSTPSCFLFLKFLKGWL